MRNYCPPTHFLTIPAPTACGCKYALRTSLVVNRSTSSTARPSSNGSAAFAPVARSRCTHCTHKQTNERPFQDTLSAHLPFPAAQCADRVWSAPPKQKRRAYELDADGGAAASAADGGDAVAHLEDAEELEVGEVVVAEGVGGFGVVQEVVGVVGEEQDQV